MSPRLSGKVCVITGTGGSMGRAAALAFAREGAMVVGCDLNVDSASATAQLVRQEGGTMESLQPCRLGSTAECQALVNFAVRAFGRIDVLFNNAAMAYFNWLEDISDEGWDRNRREEVDLVFYLTRAAWPHLKRSRGVVVNTAVEGSRMGGQHARQDPPGPFGPPGGGGERGVVPRLRRKLLRDGCGHRGRWRNEGLVIESRAPDAAH